MGSGQDSAFTTGALREAIEAHSGEGMLALYEDDARVRVIDHADQPSHPRVLRGRGEIEEMLADSYGREMIHRLDQCVIDGDHAAFTESCQYPDGNQVYAESMVTLRDGRISEQILIQAWDE
ncbi:nuclear transport factor 2 family protein [Streptomyces sp. NPDC058459]|uniref:nuclear transport factor 2 family protein n=1 Tax=Streptomyces sp. NPDC058459 TaxID=3346508 RepID=UPI00364D964D